MPKFSMTPREMNTLVKALYEGEGQVASFERISRPLTRAPLVDFLHDVQGVLFPHCATLSKGSDIRPIETIGQLLWTLTGLIHRANQHDCVEPLPCPALDDASRLSRDFFLALPTIQQYALKDADAAYAGDPAARGVTEIISTYPGFYATLVYRLAHQLFQQGVPLLPRMMTEVAHSDTGIDIHPGAQIGMHFFIDHGTGVVIGETTEIGDQVTLYQGVTLGALNFPHDSEGHLLRGSKRHPTIEHDVVIYSEATILGGETCVGHDSVIGGNVWLTESVPPFSKVTARSTISLRTRKNPVS